MGETEPQTGVRSDEQLQTPSWTITAEFVDLICSLFAESLEDVTQDRTLDNIGYSEHLKTRRALTHLPIETRPWGIWDSLLDSSLFIQKDDICHLTQQVFLKWFMIEQIEPEVYKMLQFFYRKIKKKNWHHTHSSCSLTLKFLKKLFPLKDKWKASRATEKDRQKECGKG